MFELSKPLANKSYIDLVVQQSARKAVAAVSRLATRRAVPARTFMAPTVSRRGKFSTN
jgi:hypothetical protein